MSRRVFICHASEDAETARQIAAALEREGVRCWIAPRDIDPGANYTQAILDGLAAASALVLVFSSAANDSPHVRRELEIAVGTDTAILPVRLEDVEPSGPLRYFIGTSQWLDGWRLPPEVWKRRLVDATRRLLGMADAPLAEPSRTPVPAEPGLAPVRQAPPPISPRGETWGRETLTAQISDLLVGDRPPLVVMTGLGGIGKSRVASLVVTDVHARGRRVHVHTADDTTTPDDLLGRVAASLDDGEDAVVLWDDLDLVPDAAAAVSRLMQQSPQLSILATSRLPLGLEREHQVAVPPLGVPDAGASAESVASSPAVQLFRSAAGRGAPSYRFEGHEQQTGSLCRQLDGVPLALELAAERLNVLGLDRLCLSLSSGMDVLRSERSTRPVRQRDLSSTIAWTVDRLDAPDRTLAQRLAVFEAGFTLAAVEAVCPDLESVADLIGRLLSTGLVRADDVAHEMRYSLLVTVRGFLRAMADPAQEGPVQKALADHLLQQVRDFAARLDTADGHLALSRFELEAPGAEAAIDTALERGDVESAVDLLLTAGPLWVASGRLAQALARGRAVAIRLPADSPKSAQVGITIGRLAYHLNDWPVAVDELESALALATRLADEATIAAARCYLGATRLMTGDVDEGARLAALAYEDSQRLGLYPMSVEALSVVAISHAVRGEYDDERHAHERRLELARRHGDLARTADALNTLAEIALDESDAETAHQYATESLRLATGRLPLESRDATITLARAAAVQGGLREAAALLRTALADSDRIGQALAVANCLRVGGCLAAGMGEPARAVRLFAAGQIVSPSPNGTDVPVELDLAAALEAARATLGMERAAREWTLGAGLPLSTMLAQLDEAVTLTLAGPVGRT